MNKQTITPFVWSSTNIQLPKRAKWDFSLRKWQIPIINDLSPNIVIMKPAQVGMSTVSLAKMFYIAYFVPMRIAYTLPRDKDVTDMVQTRVNAIIENSTALKSRLVGADSVRTKQIGDTYIHFMESSTEPRSLDVDYLINDEVDLSDQDNLDKFQARLFASQYKLRMQLGTPTSFAFGMDKLLRESTWCLWTVKCPFCGKHSQFDSNWTDILHYRNNGRVYYGFNCCDKCKDVGLKSSDISEGTWQPTQPTKLVTGYQIVRTMDAATSAKDVYIGWKSTNSLKNFHNLYMGLPYSASNILLSVDMVLDKCADSSLTKETDFSKCPYFVGVDQGNDLHTVVIRKGDDGTIELVHAEVMQGATSNPFTAKLKPFLSKFGKHNVVIDMLPNVHSAKDIQKDNKNIYLAIFQQSAAQQDGLYKLSKNQTRLVNIARHEVIDELIENYISTGKLRLYSDDGRVPEIVREVAKHVSNIQRVSKSREGFLGQSDIAIWDNGGKADHFLMALLYAYTAMKIWEQERSKGFVFRVI